MIVLRRVAEIRSLVQVKRVTTVIRLMMMAVPTAVPYQVVAMVLCKMMKNVTTAMRTIPMPV